MGRRKIEEHNIRKITKISGGTSYAITLPIDALRRWGWKERQKVVIKVDDKTKTLTISDWPVSPKAGRGGKK